MVVGRGLAQHMYQFILDIRQVLVRRIGVPHRGGNCTRPLSIERFSYARSYRRVILRRRTAQRFIVWPVKRLALLVLLTTAQVLLRPLMALPLLELPVLLSRHRKQLLQSTQRLRRNLSHWS